MKKLSAFHALCVTLQLVSIIALAIEIYVKDIGSITAVYVWAGLAIAGLVGNAVGALYAYARTKNMGAE